MAPKTAVKIHVMTLATRARQKLGKERSAEQLGLVVLKGCPDLIERKRALDATGHRKVHHGNVGEHLKEDAQDRRGNHGQDKQAKRTEQRSLEPHTEP